MQQLLSEHGEATGREQEQAYQVREVRGQLAGARGMMGERASLAVCVCVCGGVLALEGPIREKDGEYLDWQAQDNDVTTAQPSLEEFWGTKMDRPRWLCSMAPFTNRASHEVC